MLFKKALNICMGCFPNLVNLVTCFDFFSWGKKNKFLFENAGNIGKLLPTYIKKVETHQQRSQDDNLLIGQNLVENFFFGKSLSKIQKFGRLSRAMSKKKFFGGMTSLRNFLFLLKSKLNLNSNSIIREMEEMQVNKKYCRMATSKEVLFSIDDRKDVLRLPVTDATKVYDLRDALKIKCANTLGEFDAAQLDLFATQDGKVKDDQTPLDVFEPVTAIGDKDIVVIRHPLPKSSGHRKQEIAIDR